MPHQSTVARRECGKVTGLKRYRAAVHPGPVTIQHQLTREEESNTPLAKATMSNLTKKYSSTPQKKKDSEWHNVDLLMAAKTKVCMRKNFYPIPLHRFGSQGSCTWSLKAAVSGNNFAAVDAAATSLLFA